MAEIPAVPSTCPGCGAALSASALACGQCLRLVHAEKLDALAKAAGEATREGRTTDALAAWREALSLLPESTRQHAVVLEKVKSLSTVVDAGAPPKQDPAPKWLASFGALGLLLWKFKFVLVLLATKGKLLLLGLTKASTFLSMFVAFGAYWAIWGWWLAFGIIATTYVHEIGHVAAMARFGIQATSPMFVPGFGAFVRLKQRPVSVVEDARIGLAGPEWGFAVSVLCMVLGHFAGFPAFAAIGKFSAFVNLFNLLPISSLDGARGFRAMSRTQRWWAVAAIGGAWFWTSEGLLVLLLATAAVAAFSKSAPETGDRRAFLTYAGLVVLLSLLATTDVPVPT